MKHKTIAGVDVSKDWLDVNLAGEVHVERIENTTAAIEAWLDRVQVELVAFEATGGWERTLQDAVCGRKIPFVRVHPNQVIAFRKSRAIKAKTDHIDARLITAFTAEELVRRGLRPTIMGDTVLRELAARRRQLIDTLHGERCRLALAHHQAVRTGLMLVIEALTASLEALEAELARHIAADPDATELSDLLQSFKSAGPVTATTLLADLPELGCCSGKEIASLVGLAPHTRKSGKARGRRERTGHGRPGVRRVLFNAARCAIQHNPEMKAFYQRLVTENGRPGKVALIAVMRKILVTLNAIARDREPWRLAAQST